MFVIVALALALGETLPPEPDSSALARFIAKRRIADPDHFPDLSISIVKLMGPGEYEIQRPGQTADGHFGLRGMRERVEQMSGRLTVGCGAQGGTRVEVVVDSAA